MSLAPRLDIRQSQSLVMTPQLQQAIKLLALSNLEIESFIAEELEKNPLLAASSGDSEAAVPIERAEPAPVSSADETATADRLMVAGDGVADAPLDVDYTARHSTTTAPPIRWGRWARRRWMGGFGSTGSAVRCPKMAAISIR